MFSTYLKENLKKSGYTFKTFIAKLQLIEEYQESFENLDIVAVSRWVNGKNLPSTSKQLKIIKLFEGNVLSGIEFIEANDVSNAFSRAYDMAFDFIENPYHNLVLADTIETEACEIEEETIAVEEFLRHVANFYEKMPFYKNALLDIRNSQLKMFSIKENCRVLSHISIVENSSFLTSIFGKLAIIKMEIPTVNMGYFPNRACYEKLVGSLLTHVLTDSKNKSINIVLRGYHFLKIFEFFEMKVLSLRKTEKLGTIYLIELDLEKTLAHPFVINLVKSYKRNCLSPNSYSNHDDEFECINTEPRYQIVNS